MTKRRLGKIALRFERVRHLTPTELVGAGGGRLLTLLDCEALPYRQPTVSNRCGGGATLECGGGTSTDDCL